MFWNEILENNGTDDIGIVTPNQALHDIDRDHEGNGDYKADFDAW